MVVKKTVKVVGIGGVRQLSKNKLFQLFPLLLHSRENSKFVKQEMFDHMWGKWEMKYLSRQTNML